MIGLLLCVSMYVCTQREGSLQHKVLISKCALPETVVILG